MVKLKSFFCSERKKMFGSLVTPLVGRHVVKHGFRKMEGKFAIAERKKMKSGIFIYWVRTHWLGAML